MFERGFQLIDCFTPGNGFSLHKGDLCDAVCLCYGYSMPCLPTECIYDASFTVDHFSLVPMVVV